MINKIDERKIGAHFLPAIFNDDRTGLSDADCDLFDHWFIQNSEFEGSIFEVVDDSEEFYLCDITNLMSDVVTVNIWK